MNALTRFLSDLSAVAQKLGPSSYAFTSDDSTQTGILQLGYCEGNQISIHRIWSIQIGHGHGSRMLNKLCHLADLHGIEIMLRVIPFGQKPYPMDKRALASWYQRHGFEGKRWKLSRLPRKLIRATEVEHIGVEHIGAEQIKHAS